MRSVPILPIGEREIMARILTLPREPRSGPARTLPEGHSATLFFFTGVRYERREEPGEDGPARRPSGSVGGKRRRQR